MASLHALAAILTAAHVHVEASHQRLCRTDLRLVLRLHPLFDHPSTATRAPARKRGIQDLVHVLGRGPLLGATVVLAFLAARLLRIRLRSTLRERRRLALAAPARLFECCFQLADPLFQRVYSALQTLAPRTARNAENFAHAL